MGALKLNVILTRSLNIKGPNWWGDCGHNFSSSLSWGVWDLKQYANASPEPHSLQSSAQKSSGRMGETNSHLKREDLAKLKNGRQKMTRIICRI